MATELIRTTEMTPQLQEKLGGICKEMIDLLMKKHGLAPEMAYGVLDHLLCSYPENAPRVIFRKVEKR